MRVRVDSGLTLDAREVPVKVLERLRVALSFPNPAHSSRVRLGLPLHGVPETLCFLEERGDEVGLPRGAIQVLRQVAAQEGLVVACDDARALPDCQLPPMPALPLRDYQRAAVEKLVKATQGTVVLPCGGGKTRLAMGAIARLRTPTLVLVHTLDLAEQWLSELRDKLGVDGGLVGGGEERPAPVTVAAVQALAQWDASKLDALLGSFGFLVVDECLPGDARVVVRDHGARLIADVVLSDAPVEVLSFNHELETPEFRKVTAKSSKVVRRRFVTLTIRRECRPVKLLRLRVTEEHPVFVRGRGYVSAIEVKPQDSVLLAASCYPCQTEVLRDPTAVAEAAKELVSW